MTLNTIPFNLNEFSDALLRASLLVQWIEQSGKFNVSSKGIEGPLTSADLLSNQILKQYLFKLDSKAAWLSEESLDSDERLNSFSVWIVDPIDGTRDFIDGTGNYSVSAGYAIGQSAIAGGVAIPFSQRVITGADGKLQSLRYRFTLQELIEKKIVRITNEHLMQGVIAGGVNSENTSFQDWICFPDEPILNFVKGQFQITYIDENTPLNLSYTLSKLHPKDDRFVREYPELARAKVSVSENEFRKGRLSPVSSWMNLEPSGSIARKLALLSVGECDLIISFNPKNEWDICAGSALVSNRKGMKMIELKSGERHLFNRKSPASMGLAAGDDLLVDQFYDCFLKEKWTLYQSYY